MAAAQVATSVWRPRADGSGYLELVRTKTIGEVFDEVRAIVGEYPDGCNEYLTIAPEFSRGDQWPSGRIVAFSVNGSSEGDYSHLEVHGETLDRRRALVFLGKTFDGRDASWLFARRQREARKSGTRKWGDHSPEELERFKREKREKGRAVSQERAGAALESVLELMSSGELPSMVARVWIARQEGLSPMVHWSLGNQLLALLAGTSDARGYRQWQDAGRHVVKGAKAFHILGPSTRKVEDKETGDDKVIVLGFHPIPVFRFEDTDGFPLEPPDFDPPAPPPLADVAARWGISVNYGHNPKRSWLGLYQHAHGSDGSGRITLATHAEQVFFHELAHAAHQRMLQASGSDLSKLPTSRKELVAELTAAVLGQLHGLTLGDLAWSREYLQSHAGAKSLGSACMGVLSEVQGCLTAILAETEGS